MMRIQLERTLSRIERILRIAWLLIQIWTLFRTKSCNVTHISATSSKADIIRYENDYQRVEAPTSKRRIFTNNSLYAIWGRDRVGFISCRQVNFREAPAGGLKRDRLPAHTIGEVNINK